MSMNGARLYVSRLPLEMTEETLRSLVQERTGVAPEDVLFRSKYAFVTLPADYGLEKAIEQLNGVNVMGSQLLVEPSRSPSQRGNALHISNIPEQCPWEEFYELASSVGEFQSCEQGPSKFKGYVAVITYQNADEAQEALTKLRRHEIRPNTFLRVDISGSRGARNGGARTRPQNTLPLRMLVPSEMVGAIIGRGGATIRTITQQSRARVDVHRRENAGSPEKVVTIFGNPENCSAACQKIMELMQEEANNTNKGDIPLKLLAHNNLIGRIIGKKGATVKHIMEQTNTKITCGGGDAWSVERTICVKGIAEAIGAAERFISAKLQQSYANDMAYPQHPPPVFHHMAPMGAQVPLGPPARGPSFEASRETTSVIVPSSTVGAIIGTGGATVREMIRASGASIKVTIPGKDEEDTGERKVVILGSAEAQWKAQMMVFRKVAFEGFQGQREIKVELLVPTSSVGRIIGKGGRTVRELQRATHALIRFPQDRKEGEENTAVHIVGDFYSTQAAQRHIRSLIQRSPNGERV